jgi:S1-C subfamily serine protease
MRRITRRSTLPSVPGVVNITSTVIVQDWFNAYPQQGNGSGSVLDKEGHILTNFHVIQDAEKLEVTLSNTHNYTARRAWCRP